MRVAPALLGLVLAGGFTAGCKGESGPAVEKYATVEATSPTGARAAEQDAVEAAPAPSEEIRNPLPPPPPPGQPLTVGMTREALVGSLGDCAQRIAYDPPNGYGSLMVETIQPKLGECVKKFEARRFLLVGGKVERIEAGVDEVAAAAADRPTEVPPTDRPH